MYVPWDVRWFLIYKVQQFDILSHFLHFYPLNNPKNQNFGKMKNSWKYHFTFVYHKWWSRCMIPEIWKAMHITFCHFRPSFAFLPYQQPEKSKFRKNEKKHGEISSFYTCVPQMMLIWYMMPGTFLVILDHFFFLLFWKNEKNTWRYYSFMHLYHK